MSVEDQITIVMAQAFAQEVSRGAFDRAEDWACVAFERRRDSDRPRGRRSTRRSEEKT